jgi:cell division protein FtsB
MNKNNFIKRFSDPKKPSRLYIVIPLVLLATYAAFLIGKAIWQHYQVNRELETLTEEIDGLKDKAKRLEQAIAYYQTPSFKEKEARGKLLYQKKGEKVVSLPSSDEDKPATKSEEDVLGTMPDETFAQPNYIRWWNFFFKGK